MGQNLSISISALQCPAPVIPQNGELINMSQYNTFLFGEIIYFKCQAGYRLIGSNSLRCIASGQWLGSQPECEGKYILKRLYHQLATRPSELHTCISYTTQSPAIYVLVEVNETK